MREGKTSAVTSNNIDIGALIMDDEKKEKKFEDIESDSGIISEFWEFICENKKFWLIPLIVILLLLGLLIFLGGTSAAPFIYTIF